MTLRTKLLAMFLLLGVVPLLALGILGYRRSTGALEDLLSSRTHALAQRAAEELGHRYALAHSDLQFLANNSETQRLLRQGSGPNEALPDAVRSAAHSFLDEAWEAMDPAWRWVEVRNPTGEPVHRFGVPVESEVNVPESGVPGASADYRFELPIHGPDGADHQPIGSIRGSLPLSEVLPRSELVAGFGEQGYSVVIDRDRGGILFHPQGRMLQRSLSSLLGPSGWDVAPELLSQDQGSLFFSEDGTDRIASFVSLADPPWTVVSSESLQEFATPFARSGLFNLLVVLIVTGTISVAFILLTRRATDSLIRLTQAADEVAGGNLQPELPSTGQDEVGRLTAAFAVMVGQVRAMLRRIEESRHMSAIGAFTAQLSHEIRNPLTSIKLNLQRLNRGVEDQHIPEEYSRAVQICLREVKRLDGTVRGVLSIARTRTPRRDRVSLHGILRATLETISPQLEEQRLETGVSFDAQKDEVLGDQEQLEGAFLNLFLNAAEAMEEGGRLRVSTTNVPMGDTLEEHTEMDLPMPHAGVGVGMMGDAEEEEGQKSVLARAPAIRVRIMDDGPGIPPEQRDRIFDPFFSTKQGGTGFGLPLAVRVMEEHRGALVLAQGHPSESGATFQVFLPLAPAERG